jgi:ankyrin repeat protein
LAEGHIHPETFDYDGSGLYPLHLAVTSGSAATVRVLAAAGFNVQQRNGSGITAIAAALNKGYLDLVEVRSLLSSSSVICLCVWL